MAQQVSAGPSGYRFGQIVSIEIDGPPESTPKEDRRFFDCRDFLITQRDVAFALKHARPVTERYFLDELIGVGCFAGAIVTFSNGDRVYVLLEPTGRLSTKQENGRDAGRHTYYRCRACETSRWWGGLDQPPASGPAR